ncbi:response regulator transcription factor [Aeromonas schubertii]|uniref:Response regulator transcription factor n=1 Tax=Aeromonas schubertii TaxID=652 RepID=A0A0S2SJS8_9GAMM|nr:response regulator transcription factor [Aeromonas schubertii]ALP41922.1 two component system response regulator, LuxR family protein [Aeromonas schubertii]MBZ6067729.1 response regulator transcription factor [Aeromonas schubertii]MBZ6071016.1 response regulator transcription factor [Aeromonas schubertii]
MDSSLTIVIADDHPLFRGALYQAVHLAMNQAHLLEADSIDSLLTLLGEHDEVDLLLLDLKMPGANGLEGLAHLRGQYPDLPVVVVSAAEEPAIIGQVMAMGALGFIPKSSPMKTLVDALTTVLGGDTWLPEGIALQQEEYPLAERLSSLTPQQYKVLLMLRDGSLNKQIAWELSVSEATIKAHITAIFRKLGVKNRTQAVIALQQLDL